MRRSYEFIVKKSKQGSSATVTVGGQASKRSEPHSSSNKKRRDGAFELAGATLTDNESDTGN